MRLLLVGKADEPHAVIYRALVASTAPAFQVEWASTTSDAQLRMVTGRYDVLVVDTEGETLLGRMRDRGVRTPALVLTSGGWDDLPAHNARGMDDYLPRVESSNGNALVRAVVGLIERDALANELAAASEDAAQTTAVLAGLRHSLATPLGVIAGMAEIVLEDEHGLDADGRTCLEDLLEAVEGAICLLQGSQDQATAAMVHVAPRLEPTAQGVETSGRRTVLIADDDPATRRLVSLALASDQYSVLQAADGKEAWRLIREHHPLVAILDWQMPIYSGLELSDVIKSDPQVWGMTVIMLTGRTTDADRRAGAQARADLYLTKPFSPQELLSAVDQALASPDQPA